MLLVTLYSLLLSQVLAIRVPVPPFYIPRPGYTGEPGPNFCGLETKSCEYFDKDTGNIVKIVHVVKHLTLGCKFEPCETTVESMFVQSFFGTFLEI